MSENKGQKSYSHSLTYYAWQRLKKNSLAMFGVVVIVIAILVSVLGALIRPDDSPMANQMSLQLGLKSPGFSVQMIKVRKNRIIEEEGIFKQLFFGGKESDYTIVPINDYSFEDTYVVAEQYNEGGEGPLVKYNLADVIYPLNQQNYFDNDASDNYLEFHTLDGEKNKESINELREEVKGNHIVVQTYWLGTDRYGRDLLSRLMSGTLVSLSVGFISVFISLIIGLFLGAVAGFYRGIVDDIIVWLINVVWSIPTLLLVIAIILALGKGFWQAFIAVGLTMWVEVARVVRGQILGIREKEYIEAGKALGFTNSRIIFRHVLPNVMGPVIVICAANFASAILFEAGLSFLGIGVQPPMASWGTMIRDHYGYIITGKAFLAVLPGFAIMILVLAFMLVGNGLRDALDSRDLEDSEPIMSY